MRTGEQEPRAPRSVSARAGHSSLPSPGGTSATADRLLDLILLDLILLAAALAASISALVRGRPPTAWVGVLLRQRMLDWLADGIRAEDEPGIPLDAPLPSLANAA